MLTKICRKGGSLLLISLRTLPSPYIVPGLVPTSLRGLVISSGIQLDATSFLKILSIRFPWLTVQLKVSSFFRLPLNNNHCLNVMVCYE